MAAASARVLRARGQRGCRVVAPAPARHGTNQTYRAGPPRPPGWCLYEDYRAVWLGDDRSPRFGASGHSACAYEPSRWSNAGTASGLWSDGGGRLRTEQKNIDKSHPAEAKKRHEEQQIKLHADGDGDDASPDEDKSDKADGSVRKSTRVRKKARV